MNHETQAFICDVLLRNEKELKEKVYLRQPRNGQWHEYTWADVIHQARQVAAFLLKKGCKRGDHIAIISKNCAEWFITDFGITLAGMVCVPLFSNQNEENIHYILDHAEIKLVFIGKLDDHRRIRSYIPKDYATINFDYHPDLKTDYNWRNVLETTPVETIKKPSPKDLYTIIYSSGTSGPPKGALYDHQTIANYLSVFPTDIKRISDVEHYRLLSYLPLAHVYERTAIQLGSLTIPCDVSFVESLDKFAENLREVKPTLFTAVPRIWGVFQQKILQKLSLTKLKILLMIPGIAFVIKKKIRHELGLSECTNCFSGASHLPEDILNFFDKLGIRIQEGYGQTENLAYATFAALGNYRKGYVGGPRTGVKIKLGEHHELLIDSDCLMSGYYKNEVATKSAFTEEGWLRTGDIAEIDEENRVKILGRLSEVFKNQKGEFVSPTPIEEKFGKNHFIEHLCLIGQSLPSNVMLIQLSDEGRKKSRTVIEGYLKNNLRRVNSELQSFEKISHTMIVKGQWTIDNDMLTPTLKVKRRIIESKYHAFIQESIEKNSVVIWQK